MLTLTDWLGFIGVSLILIAYFLNLSNRLTAQNFWFILMNLIGSLLACTASILMKYIPFIILEGVWMLVSIHALFRYKK